MITVTLSWWGWLLYILILYMIFRVSSWLGDKTGRALYRRVQRRKTQRALRDTITGS